MKLFVYSSRLCFETVRQLACYFNFNAYLPHMIEFCYIPWHLAALNILNAPNRLPTQLGLLTLFFYLFLFKLSFFSKKKKKGEEYDNRNVIFIRIIFFFSFHSTPVWPLKVIWFFFFFLREIKIKENLLLLRSKLYWVLVRKREKYQVVRSLLIFKFFKNNFLCQYFTRNFRQWFCCQKSV